MGPPLFKSRIELLRIAEIRWQSYRRKTLPWCYNLSFPTAYLGMQAREKAASRSTQIASLSCCYPFSGKDLTISCAIISKDLDIQLFPRIRLSRFFLFKSESCMIQPCGKPAETPLKPGGTLAGAKSNLS